jgi:preprotein translocase subunit YajC
MILATALLLQAGGSGLTSFIFLGAMFLIFWLFLIRPQAKKQKEQKVFTEALQKGDEIVTASGILGRINKIEGDIVTLDVGNKTFIRVTKTAVSKELTEQVFPSHATQSQPDKEQSN